MGTGAFILLLGGAILIGLVPLLFASARPTLEGVLVGLGAALGGYVASEYLGAFSAWGWEFDGMRVFPALIGAIVVGGVVDLVVRGIAPQSPIPSA
jgi:uncharacterized membrane protein YeaQ/YmgE (transglycosylase-associated protein family)